MRSLARRIEAALAGTPLAERLGPASAAFAARRGGDAAGRALDDTLASGLARLLATQPETATYLSNRPAWLERAAALRPESLAARAATLVDDGAAITALDLEDALDALRLRRRDEMALAACADLAGLVPFEEVSGFLSLLAETTTRFALSLARRQLPGPDVDEAFAVVGMGKIAGREFTYHSDLDLIFLYRGGTSEIERASRIGQRLIAYLTTMTGAGIAYEVDTRLRPSGQQGMLVTSLDSYRRYQTREAAPWEHLAMLRARPIAGSDETAARTLASVRDHVVPSDEPPWRELAALRQRVVDERARDDDGARAFKTGPGGLMDVDFLAGGGLLERGAAPFPPLPSVPAMLRAAAPRGSQEALLSDYRTLRRIESRVRWVAGRGVEHLPAELALTAELVEPGLSAEGLREQVKRTRRRIRAAYARVVAAGSIGGL